MSFVSRVARLPVQQRSAYWLELAVVPGKDEVDSTKRKHGLLENFRKEPVEVAYVQVACHGNFIDNEQKAPDELKLLVSGDSAPIVEACDVGTFYVD